MIYIQRKDSNGLETVDELETRKEAREMLKEYRLSDNSAEYYTSQRACKEWKAKDMTINTLKNTVAAYNAQFNVEELPVNRLNPSEDVLARFAAIIDENRSIDEEYQDDVIEALESLIDNECEDDYSFEFDGKEYRIILDGAIWDIYVDTIKEITKDCYDLKLDDMPHFVAFTIDWEETAKNCYVDGYGHTFSGYDGSELNAGNAYIFRTN